MEVNFLVAFLAGLVSFLAPCLVPLLPAYISFISGVSLSELKDQKSFSKYRKTIFLNSLFYVLGFSLVFVLLGLTATGLSKLILTNREILMRIGGILIIFFGVSLTGIFDRFAVAAKEYHFNLPDSLKKIKFLGPFLMGNTFALAWTPCVGVVLGAILTLAATSQNIAIGGALLFVYSLGIALPFLLVGLFLSSSIGFLTKISNKLHTISFLGGILLIIVGILMATQNYDFISRFILENLNKIEFYRNLQFLI